MTILRAGDREFHNLLAGQVLTVVASAASAGIVRRYPADSGFAAIEATPVAAGATLTVGPFTGTVRVGVECTAGTVDWSFGDPAPTQVSVPGDEVATWAGLPSASSVVTGRTYTVLNTGWRVYSDGANWRPANGQLLIAARYGSVAAPIATLAGVTSGNFVLPVTPTLPAGMCAPHSAVWIYARIRRTTATATAVARTRLGTSNSTADGATSTVSLSATANLDVFLTGAAEFSGAATEYMSGGGSTWNSALASRIADVTTNVNTAAPMFASIGVDSANAADSFSLISYEVLWRG